MNELEASEKAPFCAKQEFRAFRNSMNLVLHRFDLHRTYLYLISSNLDTNFIPLLSFACETLH